MNRANLFLILGLAGGTVLGLLASGGIDGFGSGADGRKSMAEMDQSKHQMPDAGHDHGRMQEVDPLAVPSARIELKPEGGCSFNLRIELTNFRLAPENVNGPHIAGEGHAHIYADGLKLARVYSDWFHFTAPMGSKLIELTLNSNDHATLTHKGTPISTTAIPSDC